jgi:adenylate cyclase
MQTREAALHERFSMTTLSLIDSLIAKEKARSGDPDGAIELARSVVEHLSETGEMFSRGAVTSAFVELLLSRGTAADLSDAQEALDALTAAPTEPGSVINELPALGLRAQLARARGDEACWRDRMAEAI